MLVKFVRMTAVDVWDETKNIKIQCKKKMVPNSLYITLWLTRLQQYEPFTLGHRPSHHPQYLGHKKNYFQRSGEPKTGWPHKTSHNPDYEGRLNAEVTGSNGQPVL